MENPSRASHSVTRRPENVSGRAPAGHMAPSAGEVEPSFPSREKEPTIGPRSLVPFLTRPHGPERPTGFAGAARVASVEVESVALADAGIRLEHSMTTSVRERVSARGVAKGITTLETGQHDFSEPRATSPGCGSSACGLGGVDRGAQARRACRWTAPDGFRPRRRQGCPGRAGSHPAAPVRSRSGEGRVGHRLGGGEGGGSGAGAAGWACRSSGGSGARRRLTSTGGPTGMPARCRPR